MGSMGKFRSLRSMRLCDWLRKNKTTEAQISHCVAGVPPVVATGWRGTEK